jgi:ADP-heptose:LPS heptosyltransferase
MQIYVCDKCNKHLGTVRDLWVQCRDDKKEYDVCYDCNEKLKVIINNFFIPKKK